MLKSLASVSVGEKVFIKYSGHWSNIWEESFHKHCRIFWIMSVAFGKPEPEAHYSVYYHTGCERNYRNQSSFILLVASRVGVDSFHEFLENRGKLYAFYTFWQFHLKNMLRYIPEERPGLDVILFFALLLTLLLSYVAKILHILRPRNIQDRYTAHTFLLSLLVLLILILKLFRTRPLTSRSIASVDWYFHASNVEISRQIFTGMYSNFNLTRRYR